MWEKRLKEIRARKTEIRGLLEGDSKDIKLDELETELRNLDTEQADIEKRTAIARGINNGTISADPVLTPGSGADPQKRDFGSMPQEELLKAPEYRSAYLKKLQRKQLNEVERQALTVGEQRAMTTDGGSAGAAVPSTTFNLVIDKLRQTSVLFPLITSTFIPGNLNIVVANAKNAAKWSAEAVDGSDDNDSVVSVSLGGFLLAKFVKLSINVLTMTIDAFEAYISAELGRQLAIAIENAILSGLGPNPGGGNKPQPTGIIPGIAWDTTNSLTYTTLDYDSLVDGRAKLGTLYRSNAIFVMNSNMEAAMMKIKTSTGKPIFSQDPQNGFTQKILNRPYIVDDYMPDDTILFCDPSYYKMNFSQSPVIETSRDAGFMSSSVVYRGLLIADGKPALTEAFVKISKAS